MTHSTALPESVLVKKQVQQHKIEGFRIDGGHGILLVDIRYDDRCGNGHNSFSITGSLYRDSTRERDMISCGCIHDDIEEYAPQFKHLIEWHLTSSDGPMHYIANTMYHAREHGPKMAHVRLEDPANDVAQSSVKYTEIEKAEAMAASNPIYKVDVDEKTAKIADLKAARNSAVWPEATLQQLQDADALEARLPALMTEFKTMIESLGMEY